MIVKCTESYVILVYSQIIDLMMTQIEKEVLHNSTTVEKQISRHGSHMSSRSDTFGIQGRKFQTFIQGTTFHGVRFIFNPDGAVLRR